LQNVVFVILGCNDMTMKRSASCLHAVVFP